MKFEHIKIIIRTIFYQFFLLFVGLSVGFLMNPEHAGYKLMLFRQSYENIFYPVRYSPELERFLINIGRERLARQFDMIAFDPEVIKLKEDFLLSEEFYNAYYYDKDGKLQHFSSRILWRPWEWYYPSPEEMKESDQK